MTTNPRPAVKDSIVLFFEGFPKSQYQHIWQYYQVEIFASILAFFFVVLTYFITLRFSLTVW